MADELYPEVLGVATLTDLLALGPATTPVPRLDHATIFVREAANRGWWYYDPDATTGGQTPTSDGVGRWFGPVPYQISAAGVLGNLGGSGGVVGAVAIAALRTELNVITLTTGAAPYYGSRAFVRFNGTGTIAINASGNVSSITDNGTGNYTVNYSTAVPANSAVFSSSYLGTGTGNLNIGAEIEGFPGTGSCNVRTGVRSSNSYVDHALVNVVVFA